MSRPTTPPLFPYSERSARRHRHRSTSLSPGCSGSRGGGGQRATRAPWRPEEPAVTCPRRRTGLPADRRGGRVWPRPRRGRLGSCRRAPGRWGRCGVRQVRAGQVAEPGEVARAGRIIGGVHGHGRHLAVSGGSLAENGRPDRVGGRTRVGGRQAGDGFHRGRGVVILFSKDGLDCYSKHAREGQSQRVPSTP